MPCPFPGMDPYIERPAIWGDFQFSFAVRISGALNAILRTGYAAMTNRMYFSDEDFQLEVRLVEPRDLRLVTAMEILTPENKSVGPRRVEYVAKRREYLKAGINVVEINLLRGGRSLDLIQIPSQARRTPIAGRYSVAVYRRTDRQEARRFKLSEPLPKISIPLNQDDADVNLDLQGVFTQVWEEGPYPELLHYDRPLPSEFAEDEQRWCRELLDKAPLRATL